MIVDCDTCSVRGHGCADCVLTVLLGQPSEHHQGHGPALRTAGGHGPELSMLDLNSDERRAVSVLHAAGLVASLDPLPVVEVERRERRRGPIPLHGPVRRAAGY